MPASGWRSDHVCPGLISAEASSSASGEEVSSGGGGIRQAKDVFGPNFISSRRCVESVEGSGCRGMRMRIHRIRVQGTDL